MGGDEIGGPGISQVHLQILGDGGRILFLAEISLGKGSGRYQPKGQSGKPHPGQDFPTGWASLISLELTFGVNNCLSPQSQLHLLC